MNVSGNPTKGKRSILLSPILTYSLNEFQRQGSRVIKRTSPDTTNEDPRVTGDVGPPVGAPSVVDDPNDGVKFLSVWFWVSQLW